jgi:hypothetical protein
VLCLAVVAAGCGGGDGSVFSAGSSTTVSPPTSSVDRTTTTSSTLPSTSITSEGLMVSPALDLGEGFVFGGHASLPLVYVTAVDHETTEVGCEGGDVGRLWLQPLDGGARSEAIPGRFFGGGLVLGGAAGLVATVSSCDGRFGGIGTARMNADGTLSAIAALTLSGIGPQDELRSDTIRWSSNGRWLLGLLQVSGGPLIATRIGLDGAVTKLEDKLDLVAVADLGDGRLVTATSTGVTIAGQPSFIVPVTSIEVSPNQSAVAIFGDDGVRILTSGGILQQVATGPARTGRWSPDGTLLAYTQPTGDSPHGQASVCLVSLHGGALTMTKGNAFDDLAFSADSRTVVYSTMKSNAYGEVMSRQITTR